MSDTTTDTDDRELRPAGRYEWEQIIRRARFRDLIPASERVGSTGRRTRGGVDASKIKAVALAYASWGDDKGADIWPGDANVAVALECDLKVVRAVKQALLSIGLLQRVRGRRYGRGEELRLTIPEDLLERVEVLTPAQFRLAAERVRERARGKRAGSGGPPEAAGVGGPVDHPNDPDPPDVGWSGGPAQDGSGWSTGPALGGPVDPHTDHDRPTNYTDHADRDLHTDPATSAPAPGRPKPDLSEVEAAARARLRAEHPDWPDDAVALLAARLAERARPVGTVAPPFDPDLGRLLTPAEFAARTRAGRARVNAALAGGAQVIPMHDHDVARRRRAGLDTAPPDPDAEHRSAAT